MKYKTRYTSIVPKGSVGTLIAEVESWGIAKLMFDNGEQFWFMKRDLKEVN